MKTGLVLEGGGLRGIFSAGVLDVLMEEGIEFDGAVGVSAGAAFGCNYKSKQPRRAIRYNLRFAKDPRYSSLRSLLATGDLFNAQFCYHEIPEKLFPFDWETFRANPMQFYLVCTDVETGKPVYHLCDEKDSEWEILEWFRASGSMPLVSRIVDIDGRKLLDGGISDSIPLRFMEEQGFERNLVILTQPADYVKRPNAMMPVVSRAFRKYPATIQAMENRHVVYNETLAYIRSREAGKYAFVIRPQTALDIDRVEHDRFKIRAAYKEGRKTARRMLPGIRRFLSAAKTADFIENDGQGTGHETDLASVKPSLVTNNQHNLTSTVRPSLVEDPMLTSAAKSFPVEDPALTSAATPSPGEDPALTSEVRPFPAEDPVPVGTTTEEPSAEPETEGASAIETPLEEPSAEPETEAAAAIETPSEEPAAEPAEESAASHDPVSVIEDPPFVSPIYKKRVFEERAEEMQIEAPEPAPAEEKESVTPEKAPIEEKQSEAPEPARTEETRPEEPSGTPVENTNDPQLYRGSRRGKGRGQKKTWKPGSLSILRQMSGDKENENDKNAR